MLLGGPLALLPSLIPVLVLSSSEHLSLLSGGVCKPSACARLSVLCFFWHAIAGCDLSAGALAVGSAACWGGGGSLACFGGGRTWTPAFALTVPVAGRSGALACFGGGRPTWTPAFALIVPVAGRSGALACFGGGRGWPCGGRDPAALPCGAAAPLLALPLALPALPALPACLSKKKAST